MTAYAIAMWVFFGLVALLLLVVLIGVIRERMQPVEKRRESVLQQIRKNETKTGATVVKLTAGVDHDTIRDLARQEGFDWVGYSGRGNSNLNFQRSLPPRDKAVDG